jgi:hypothetical protein
MKEGVLLDPQAINRKMADAEAESYTQEELFEAEAPAPSLTLNARTIHEAYENLKVKIVELHIIEAAVWQINKKLSLNPFEVQELHDLEYKQLAGQNAVEIARLEVDRVNALTHFFEIDLLAYAGRQ